MVLTLLTQQPAGSAMKSVKYAMVLSKLNVISALIPTKENLNYQLQNVYVKMDIMMMGTTCVQIVISDVWDVQAHLQKSVSNVLEGIIMYLLSPLVFYSVHRERIKY